MRIYKIDAKALFYIFVYYIGTLFYYRDYDILLFLPLCVIKEQNRKEKNIKYYTCKLFDMFSIVFNNKLFIALTKTFFRVIWVSIQNSMLKSETIMVITNLIIKIVICLTVLIQKYQKRFFFFKFNINAKWPIY